MAQIRNVSIKYAMISIPIFNEFNTPVSQFATACEEVSLLVPHYNESEIAKFIYVLSQ